MPRKNNETYEYVKYTKHKYIPRNEFKRADEKIKPTEQFPLARVQVEEKAFTLGK